MKLDAIVVVGGDGSIRAAAHGSRDLLGGAQRSIWKLDDLTGFDADSAGRQPPPRFDQGAVSSAAISRGLRGEHGRVSSLLRRDRNRRRGITAPLLFDKLIATEQEGQVAIGFLIGAPVMALGGVAELLFGVKAAGEQLEDIAQPLTAEDAEQDQPADTDATRHDKKQPEPAARRAAALHASEARIRRYRLGSGRMPTSRVPGVTSLSTEPALDNEVQSLQRALDEHGATERGELARLVGARYDTGNDDPAGESNPQP